MKVTYVVPRYGNPSEVIGGAENAVRMLAERVATLPGWTVEVFTTTARESTEWAGDLPAGRADIDGVEVHRFPLDGRRTADFHEFLQRVLADPRHASRGDQQRFIDEVGPQSGELLDALDETDADVVYFCPYLFTTTINGIPRVPGRAVMQPSAHDEPPLRLPFFAEVFDGLSGIVFNTAAEQALVRGEFGLDRIPQTIIGHGVNDPPRGGVTAVDTFRAAHGLGDDPYLVSVGRVDRSKGALSLAEFFDAYKKMRPGPLKLVLLGSVAEPPRDHPDIVLTGPLPEEDKWGAIGGAVANVSPSYYESFSLVLMEGWVMGRPAIVNGRCPVTLGHVRMSGGGIAFDGYGSFGAAVDRLLTDDELGRRLGAAGRRYVDDRYRWPVVIDHYRRFLELVARRHRR